MRLAVAIIVVLALGLGSGKEVLGTQLMRGESDSDVGESEEPRELQRRSRRNGRQNHPVCYNIIQSWWKKRQSFKKIDNFLTELDRMCSTYDGDADACANKKKSRGSYREAGVPVDTLQASCNMIGSGDMRCVSNPCNQLNDGNCRLDATAGRCIWLTKNEAKRANRHLKKKGVLELYPGQGCYKNLCHANAVGRGKLTDAECEAFSIPYLMDCTYCRGTRNYKRFQKAGVGCQMTKTQTVAECAPVNRKEFGRETIFARIDNPECQCSSTYSICAANVLDDIGGREALYRQRFPLPQSSP